MVTVSVHQAKTHLSSLLASVERGGERVLIQRHGRAVAEIVPVSRESRLKVSRVLKKITIMDDLTRPTQEEWENV